MTRSLADPVTITDVAKHAGVAISSASTALNGRSGVSERTRQRVRQSAAALGYVPSIRGRSLSSKRAFAVGLVVQRDADVLETDPFFGAFIGGIEETLAPRGYALALQVAKDEDSSLARHVELAESGRVDGVFLNELHVDDPRWDALHARNFAAVAVNPGALIPELSSVTQDGSAAIGHLIEHLVGLGHRRIGHVAGAVGLVHTAERSEAWRQAVEAAGLEPGIEVRGDFTYEGGQRAAEQLLACSDGPTAVFCANDLSAIGFLNRVVDAGLRVPEDIAVAGYDGIGPGRWVRPALTTIRTSPRELGAEAARLLLQAIDGSGPTHTTIAGAAFVPRASSDSSAMAQLTD